jgi:hypothetical protein
VNRGGELTEVTDALSGDSIVVVMNQRVGSNFFFAQENFLKLQTFLASATNGDVTDLLDKYTSTDDTWVVIADRSTGNVQVI